MNKLLPIILLLINLGTANILKAQLMPTIGWFEETQLYYNPAYAGSGEDIRASILYRDQWGEIAGAPKTYLFNIDKPIAKGLGAGLNINRNTYGSSEETHVGLNGSYRIYLNATSYIQGALRLSVANIVLGEKFQFDDGDELNQSTPTIVPQIGFGFLYHTPKFYIGLSSPNYYSSDTKGALHESYLRPNYFATFGTKIELTEFISLKPALLTRYYKNTGTNVLINLGVGLNQTILAGVSYSSASSFGVYGKVSVTPRVRVGYRYEFQYDTGEVEQKTLSSGEFVVVYGFK